MGWLGVVVCFALIVIAPAGNKSRTEDMPQPELPGMLTCWEQISVWPHYYHGHRENGPSSPIPNDSPNWGKWTSPGEKELGAGAPGTDPDQPGAAAS